MKQNFTVRQGALDGVEAFLSVAQHRSFRKAAAELGVTPSAISQTIRVLEARVGARAFRAHNAQRRPDRSRRTIPFASEACLRGTRRRKQVARELGQRPSGLLRLSVPSAVVPIVLQPLIASFCRAYPEVEVEIVASAELVDLAAEGFDAGVRMGQFIAADMVAIRLTPPFPFEVVGSPDYLRRRNPPERIDDLRDHTCLRMRRSNGSIASWSFVDGNKAVEAIVSGPLIAHDYPTLLGAAIQGVGLAQVPGPLAAAPIADGRLQALLTPFAVTTPGVFLYHSGRRQVLPKLRAFIEHIKYRSADAPGGETFAQNLPELDRAAGDDAKNNDRHV